MQTAIQKPQLNTTRIPLNMIKAITWWFSQSSCWNATWNKSPQGDGDVSVCPLLLKTKLSYRRGTAWRAVSVYIFSTDEQLNDKLHFKRFAIDEW